MIKVKIESSTGAIVHDAFLYTTSGIIKFDGKDGSPDSFSHISHEKSRGNSIVEIKEIEIEPIIEEEIAEVIQPEEVTTEAAPVSETQSAPVAKKKKSKK